MQKLKEERELVLDLHHASSKNIGSDKFSNRTEEFWQYFEFKSSRQGICLKNNNTTIATSKIENLLSHLRKYIENNQDEFMNVRWIRIPHQYLETQQVRTELVGIYALLKYASMVDLVIPSYPDPRELESIITMISQKENLGFLNLRITECHHLTEEHFQLFDQIQNCKNLETFFLYFQGNSLKAQDQFLDGASFHQLSRLAYFSIVTQVDEFYMSDQCLQSMLKFVLCKTLKHFKMDIEHLEMKGRCTQILTNYLRLNKVLQEIEIERANFNDVSDNEMRALFEALLNTGSLKRLTIQYPFKAKTIQAFLEVLELKKITLDKLVLCVRFNSRAEIGKIKNSFGIVSRKNVTKFYFSVKFGREIEDLSNLDELSYIVNTIESGLSFEIDDQEGVLGNAGIKSFFFALNRNYDIFGLKIQSKSRAITEKGLSVLRKSLFKFGSLEYFVLRVEKINFSRRFVVALYLQLAKMNNLHVKEVRGQTGENEFDYLKKLTFKDKCCGIF